MTSQIQLISGFIHFLRGLCCSCSYVHHPALYYLPAPTYITNIPPDARSVWLLTRQHFGVTGPGWCPLATTLALSSGPSPSSPPGQSSPRASTPWLEVEQTAPPFPPSRASPASSPPELPSPAWVVRGLAKHLTPTLLAIAVRIVFPTS